MPMHESKKRKTILSEKKLKSNSKLEFIKREILIPFNDEWDYQRREIRDHYRHKETGIVLVRVMTMYPPMTDYKGRVRSHFIRWICPELGSGVQGMSGWIREAKQTLRKYHDK